MKLTRAALPVDGSDLFDVRPIELAGFTLLARLARAIGHPTAEQWVAAAQFAVAAHGASPYWVGDLLVYAESREDWQEKFDQLVSLTGYAPQTLYNLTYIAKHVEEPERQLAPTVAHAAVVASLPRPEQTKYLTDAKDENLTVRETRQRIKTDQRMRVLEGKADVGPTRAEFSAALVVTAEEFTPMDVALSLDDVDQMESDLREVCQRYRTKLSKA